MAKIPFDIKFRPQIESGEYKVETRDGRKARIIHWDLNCTSPIVAVMDAHIDLPGEIVDVFSVSGRAFDDLESPSDLFLVTPEEEMTEFEKACMKLYNEGRDDGFIGDKLSNESLKESASELLAIAREELFANDSVLKEYAQVSREQGKAEALRTRATELTENLVKSGLDKDSIPYHLIEFMCNLYTCQNWKEIEETAEAYTTRLKAAAMKDLPRWNKAVGHCFVGQSIMCDDLCFYKSSTTKPGCRYITYDSLEKLPGFKEDSHE